MNNGSQPIAAADLSLAVTGSGGSGALTTGHILLEAVARAGLYGLMTRSVGPQIRGGESAAMVRFGPRPIHCPGDRFDFVVGLDWLNVERFVDELPLDPTSLILADPSAGAVPEALRRSGARVQEVPFKSLIADVDDGRINMAAVGTLDRKSTRLNSSHNPASRMPSSA
jgi:2-oxoglutarate ferredoxin oxidoreductase subunit alpha